MSEQDEPITEQFKARFRMSRPIPSLYAHNLTIQVAEHEVILSFFEPFIPYLIDPTPEDRERVNELGIPMECIARISVNKARFHSFARLMMDASEQLQQREKTA
jgi:hypothetical protein